MKRTLVLAVATLLLASCSAGTPGQSQTNVNEAAFLAKAREFQGGTGSEAKVDDAQLLKVGYLVCKELEAGRIVEGDRTVWATQNLPEDGVVSASHSATALCPEWYKS